MLAGGIAALLMLNVALAMSRPALSVEHSPQAAYPAGPPPLMLVLRAGGDLPYHIYLPVLMH